MHMGNAQFLDAARRAALTPEMFGIHDVRDFTIFLFGMDYYASRTGGNRIMSEDFCRWMKNRHCIQSGISWASVVWENFPSGLDGLRQLMADLEQYDVESAGSS